MKSYFTNCQTIDEAKKISANIYDHSWIEFGKASNWIFEENTAIALTIDRKKGFQIEF